MKYDGKEFNDPILRCDQCNKITHRQFIRSYGGCSHCGNKRFRNVQGLSSDEYYALKNGTLKIGINLSYELDPEFFKVFEPVEESDG